jgi:hypothetical protein
VRIIELPEDSVGRPPREGAAPAVAVDVVDHVIASPLLRDVVVADRGIAGSLYGG